MAKLASIVIVTCNRFHFARKAVLSVLQHTRYPDYELIIVDNGSEDETVVFLQEIESHPQVSKVIFFAENMGKGKAANLGFALSKGDYIIGLDDDVVVPHGWLTTLTKAIDTIPEVGWLSLNLKKPYQRTFSSEDGGKYVFKPEYKHTFGEFTVYTPPAVAGFCVAMPRSTYEKIGGYIEDCYYGGIDGNYNQRAKKAGLLTGYLADVVAIHYGGSAEEKEMYGEYYDYKADTQNLLHQRKRDLSQTNFYKEKTRALLNSEALKHGKLIRGQRSAIYFWYKNKKHLIPNLTVFYKLGFKMKNVVNLEQDFVDKIPNGFVLEG